MKSVRSLWKAAVRSVAWLLMAATLAACSSPVPTQSRFFCPQLVIAPPAMLYPANGATNVSKNNLQIILGYAYGTTLTLTSASAASVTTQAAKPASTPLPPGSASPDPGSTPIAYAVPTLAGGVKYTVVGSIGAGTPCPTGESVVGSFSTAP